jgi:hypothetical protein
VEVKSASLKAFLLFARHLDVSVEREDRAGGVADEKRAAPKDGSF